MEEINTADKVFVELKLLEKQLGDLKRDNERPTGASAPGAGIKPVEGRIEEMSHLLLRIKEQASATLGEAIRKQKEWAEMKAEMDKEKSYIRLLQKKLKEKELAVAPDGGQPGAGFAGGVPTDLGLTAEEDKAHNRLEGERKEFKEHYDSLENDFETREKEFLDEIRALREKETRMALENEKLGIDLSIAQQRREAAEQKASSAAARMMDMDVYNKSAALALKEKDQEISDLKQAVEEARSATARSGK
ncbi:MAG: hypothetical protein PHV36_02405 [Elusimicrobiales bacterium]|nr:hypothetical protein [Elusimicrobiales bacterium]